MKKRSLENCGGVAVFQNEPKLRVKLKETHAIPIRVIHWQHHKHTNPLYAASLRHQIEGTFWLNSLCESMKHSTKRRSQWRVLNCCKLLHKCIDTSFGTGCLWEQCHIAPDCSSHLVACSTTQEAFFQLSWLRAATGLFSLPDAPWRGGRKTRTCNHTDSNIFGGCY